MLWANISCHIPKNSRYTIGQRIENKFLDLLELSYAAYFAQTDNKLEKIKECIALLDILKYFITISWEAKLISHKQFENLALRLEEIGKMLGGWKKGVESKNSPKI